MKLSNDNCDKNKEKITQKKVKNYHAKLKRETIFTTFKPWNAIFIMVIPTIISVVIFSTYQIFDKWIATQWGAGNIIDSYSNIVNNITPAQALQVINTATTFATIPSSISIAFSLLISIGTSVKFSISYGKNNAEKMANYLGNGFLSSFITSIIFMIVMYFTIPTIINFQASGANSFDPKIKNIIVQEAIHFSRILVLGAPLLFFSNFWLSLLRSEGKVFSNIFIIIISCIVNIILDFIFVIIGNWGMAGTAYATIISWFLTFIVTIILIYYSSSSLKFNFHHLKLKKTLVLGILIIGLSSLLQNIAQSILAVVTIKILNILPVPIDYHSDIATNIPVYIQLYGGIMPWLILINAPIIGVSQGARSLVAYVYGSGNYYRLWQIMLRLFILLAGLLFMALLLVIFFGQYMMNMFGVDLKMATHFKIYIIMQFAFYPLATFHFLAVIFYQGINRGKIAFFASLQKTIIMPILCIWLGYLIVSSTNNVFYFYLMIGLVDLFSALILLPLLIYTFVKSRTFIFKNKEKLPLTNVPREKVEILNLKQ